MKNALDVAQYFLDIVDRESGDTITHLKLQKLVYYVQAWSLVFRNDRFYDEPIQAWPHGPVVRSVWDKYKQYGFHEIPQSSEDISVEFDANELEVLEEVWNAYGDFGAKYLEKLTHSELPWIKARAGLDPAEKSNNEISLEEMKNFYSKFLED